MNPGEPGSTEQGKNSGIQFMLDKRIVTDI